MKSRLHYSDKERAEVYCGMGIFVFSFGMGGISITQFWHNWRLGLALVIILSCIILYTNFRKFGFASEIKAKKLSKIRVCYIDSALVISNLIFLWVMLYIPVPFSIEEFLHPNDGLIFPFANFVMGAISLIPTILTNKRILAFFGRTR